MKRMSKGRVFKNVTQSTVPSQPDNDVKVKRKSSIYKQQSDSVFMLHATFIGRG